MLNYFTPSLSLLSSSVNPSLPPSLFPLLSPSLPPGVSNPFRVARPDHFCGAAVAHIFDVRVEGGGQVLVVFLDVGLLYHRLAIFRSLTFLTSPLSFIFLSFCSLPLCLSFSSPPLLVCSEYLWKDGIDYKKPTRVSAPAYCLRLCYLSCVYISMVLSATLTCF